MAIRTDVDVIIKAVSIGNNKLKGTLDTQAVLGQSLGVSPNEHNAAETN
jgi:hypothetical protein